MEFQGTPNSDGCKTHAHTKFIKVGISTYFEFKNVLC